MKTHTENYKNQLKYLGKEINSIITYSINGTEVTIQGEELNSVTPHYEGSILKSVMKQLDIVSAIDIPVGTELNCKFGLKVNNSYEYVNYGNYIVEKSEKQEDTNTFKITCYDKMLYAMKDYEEPKSRNLFDKNNYTRLTGTISITSSRVWFTGGGANKGIVISCEPNTTYTIQKRNDGDTNRFAVGSSETMPSSTSDVQTNMLNGIRNDNASVITITTGATANYLVINYYRTAEATLTEQQLLDSIQIEKGSSATPYIPFGTPTYPITIRKYLEYLCDSLGLGFANISDTFTNYDQTIATDLFKDLGYTKRDVLDQLAEVTASTICINSDDQLEVRYLKDSINETSTTEGTNINLTDVDFDILQDLLLKGNTIQNTTILPSGYTQVEYIQSNGTNAINTSFAPNQNTKVEVVVSDITGSNQFVSPFGYRNGNTKQFWCYFDPATTNKTFKARYNTTEYSSTYNYTSGGKIKISMDKTGLYIDDVLKTSAFSSATFTADANMYLFATNNNGSGQWNCIAKLYSAKIWDNGTLKRYFVPCYRNSDNVIGLYEIVGRAFYTAQGTGTFTKGSNVTLPTPDYPQEVQNVTGRQEVNVCGKNLFNKNNYNMAYGYTSGSLVATNVANVGNRDRGFWIKLQPNTTYTLSISKLNAGTDKIIGFYNQQPTTNGIVATSRKVFAVTTTNIEYTFTTDSEYIYIHTKLFNTNNQTTTYTFDEIIGSIQIEKGNTSSIYEPYIGKSYEINLGKNLFPNNITTQTINGVTFKKNDDGSININGTATAGIRLWLDDYILFPKGSYTMSATMTGTITNNLYASVRNKANNSDLIYVNLNTTTLNRTATFTEDTLGRPNLYITNGNVLTNVNLYVQLEKSSFVTSFSPYKTPIELCKIGDYQDKILKYGNDFNNTTIPKVINGCTYEIISTGYKIIPTSQQDDARIEIGTNLDVTKYADKTFTFTFTIDKSYAEVDVVLSNGTSGRTIYYIDAEQPERISSTFNVALRDDDIENNRKYLYFIFWSAVESGTQVETTYTDICLYNGTQTTYMPYGEKKWYLHKEIGKYTFTGNETFTSQSYGTNSWLVKSIINTISNDNLKLCISNIFTGIAKSERNNEISNSIYANTTTALYIRNTSFTSQSQVQSATNGNYVYYVLATSTNTEITDTELINQLESIRLLSGVNNIAVSSSNLSSPLSIAYVSNYETIDEEYIKNTRAEFGKKYGPINSIVLSRSAESDNVYIQDEDSIAENGLTELKIVDNQIMNDNTRDRFLPGLLERLDGLQYYVNDFESIGITYLELCDKYRVKIKDNYYPCVMLNNEVEVDNGLNEIIYTEAPEQTETDYKKADKTDRRINQTTLIVDKQAQTIDAIIGTDTENFSSLTELKLETDEVSSKVESNYNFVREITANNILTSEEMQTDGLMVLKITGNANSTNYLRLNISNNEQEYVDLPIKTILKQGNLEDELSIEKVFNDETNLYEYHCFIIKRLDYIDGAITQASSSTNYILAENSQILNAESGDNLMREQYVEGKEDLGVIDLVLDTGAHSFSINGYTGLDYYLQYAILNEVVGGFATKAHIISEINQTPEQISISADKVSLVGKTIDLTSDNININSNNFKVDMEGNMTCNNAKINGSVNSSSGNVGGWDITPEGLTNGDVKIMNTGGTTLYTVADFFLVQAHILGQIDLSNLMKHYDLNNDGVIDIKDLLLLQKILKINTE